MSKEVTFDSLSLEFSSKFNTAFYNMSMARTREEIEVAANDARKVIGDYTRKVKQLIDNAALQLIADHASMMKMLNDRFNLDPDKAVLTYEANRNTVRWTVTLTAVGQKFHYMSKRGRAVDLSNFYNWCVTVLLD